MEERNIKVSFEKAKEWYNSNNPTLKELALQAFKEKELARPTYSEIYSMTLKEEIAFTDIEKMLRVLAFFFKKSTDQFEANSQKYFIAYNTYGEWTVLKHLSVMYPGIPYFAREEDAKEALKIFEEALNKK